MGSSDASDPDHRPGERRQGGRRPRAPARGRSRGIRCSSCPRRPTQAHYARELARAGLVFGTEVTTFPWLMRDLARAAGIRARPLGRLARRQLVHTAIKDVRLHRARSVRGRTRLPGGARRPVRRAPALARHARPLPRGDQPVARRARPRPGARPALLRLPRAPGRAWRPSTPTASPTARSTRPATAWDGRPLFLYGFDELLPDPARPRGDAHPPHGHRGHGRGHLRARPRGDGRQRDDGRAAQAAGPRAHRARAALGALRAGRPQRAASPRAPAVRGRARDGHAQRRRPPARGRRRAGGGRARRRVGARAPARRDGRRGHRRARARPRGHGALRAGVRDLRHPGRLRAPDAVRPHPPRHRRAGLRRAPRSAGPRTTS